MRVACRVERGVRRGIPARAHTSIQGAQEGFGVVHPCQVNLAIERNPTRQRRGDASVHR
jgi:hypothetical protein